MFDYRLAIFLSIMLIVALYLLKRNNKKTIVTVGALGDDEIDIPFKKESVPGLSVKTKEGPDDVKSSSRMNVIVLLLEELIPAALQLLEKVNRAGFFVSELHLYTECGAMIYINIRADSLRKKHQGYRYPDPTKEGIILTNKKIVIQMIKEVFGEAIFYQKDSSDRDGVEVYEIQYDIAELGGSLRRSLGKDFFRRYDSLVGIHRNKVYEEGLKTGPFK